MRRCCTRRARASRVPPGPAVLGSIGCGGLEPVLDDGVGFGEIACEHEVAQSEHTTLSKDVRHPAEGDGLPEVRQMMECVPRVDDIRGTARVRVAEEARFHALDVVDAVEGGSGSSSCP